MCKQRTSIDRPEKQDNQQQTKYKPRVCDLLQTNRPQCCNGPPKKPPLTAEARGSLPLFLLSILTKDGGLERDVVFGRDHGESLLGHFETKVVYPRVLVQSLQTAVDYHIRS